jgi:GNAT superfamily N-acetyltransferase
VQILEGAQVVSGLEVVRCPIRVGAAVLRMDGIAGVETDREHRNRGLARRMLQATIDHLRRGDGALTMLYGIPDFYHRFGYATAGPDHRLHLTHLERPADLPPGWTARPLGPEDVPAALRLYEQQTSEATGAAQRAPEGGVLERLKSQAGAGPSPSEGQEGWSGCRLVIGPDGEPGAYIWRNAGFWFTDMVQRQNPQDLALSEVVAPSPAAARAALLHCRQWAANVAAARKRPVERVTFGATPDSHLAQAAREDDATIEQRHSGSGGSMTRVLDTGRLLSALAPELRERARRAGVAPGTTLHCETDEGEAEVPLVPGSSSALPSPTGSSRTIRLRLPQGVLARLALGALPPDVLLDGLETPPSAQDRDLLRRLLPLRHPHMSWPDRY